MDNISIGVKSYIPDNLQKLKQYENISPTEKPVGNKITGNDEKLTAAGEMKVQYLELAVGEREKELEKLGLTRNEDGTVTIKPNGKAEEEKETENMGEECETCANRKYQDGSDEMVSFKSAQHISPEAAATAVRAHEGEHVANAYDEAAQNDGKVLRASVAIHTSVCPECGRNYVSGGTTTTTIRYNNDNYASNAKSQDASVVPGKEIDTVV